MYYNACMRKTRDDISFSPKTPVEGFSAVLLFIGAFLVMLWTLIIIVRVVVG
jgi:hypothetical protein